MKRWRTNDNHGEVSLVMVIEKEDLKEIMMMGSKMRFDNRIFFLLNTNRCANGKNKCGLTTTKFVNKIQGLLNRF